MTHLGKWGRVGLRVWLAGCSRGTKQGMGLVEGWAAPVSLSDREVADQAALTSQREANERG